MPGTPVRWGERRAISKVAFFRRLKGASSLYRKHSLFVTIISGKALYTVK